MGSPATLRLLKSEHWDARWLTLSEAAVGIVFSGQPPVRARSNEVDVKALVSTTIFRQAVAVALKVFEVYSPTLFLGVVSCKVVLGTRRPLADFGDVVADLDGQNVDVLGIPGGVSIDGASPSFSLKSAAKQ